MNRFKKFIFNGLLLTSVSLLMRGVGVSFNVYISNTVGAEAMGLFTLISTVYGFAITLATSGINLATTRLVSEALGEISSAGIRIKNGKTPSVRAVMRKCVAYSLFFSILSALALFIGAPAISHDILRDERCLSSLRLLAISLPPLSISSALSGYFTAVRRVYKNALTQVLEQMVKILSCTALLTRFFANDAESACLCVVAGGVIAELLSFVLQGILYLCEKRDDSTSSIPAKERFIKSRLLGIALPVAFSAYLRSALITIEHILIPWGLEQSGASRSRSLAAYGTVHSMVFPLIFFPSAILSSFAGLLVPEVSQAVAEDKSNDIKRIASNVFETALFFAIGAAGIISCFAYELGNTLYPDTNAGIYIRMIAPLIPIMYLDTATDAILKGLGQQVYSMGVNIVDSLLSVILVIFLLPRFGIEGYIMTVYFTELINATLSITRLLIVVDFKPRVTQIVFKPLICIVTSGVVVSHITPPSFISSSGVLLVLHIVLASAIYLSMLFLLGSLKIKKLRKGLKLIINK